MSLLTALSKWFYYNIWVLNPDNALQVDLVLVQETHKNSKQDNANSDY